MGMPTIKWLAIVASFCAAIINFALLFTFGAFYVHLLDKYGSSRATTATVQSLFLGTGLFSGLLEKQFGVTLVSTAGSILVSTGFIASFFARGIPMLIVFIGILSGPGISLVHVSSSVVIGNELDGKQREIALAFHSFCIGIGTIAYPYILEKWIDLYGVGGTFLMLGGLFLNNFVITILFYLSEHKWTRGPDTQGPNNHTNNAQRVKTKENPKESYILEQPNGASCNSYAINSTCHQCSYLRSLRYILFVIATGLVLASINGLLVVFLDLLAWKGLSPTTSLNCFTAVNIAGFVVRLLNVTVVQLKPGLNPAFGLATGSLCGVVGNLLMFYNNESIIIFGSILTGWTGGNAISGATVAISSLVKKDDFGVAIGLLLTVNGTLSLISGPLYGFIRDSVQSYELVLLLSASLNGAGVFLYAATAYKTFCRRMTRVADIS